MTDRPVVFLDVDGTLNTPFRAGPPGLNLARWLPECMRALNRIARATGAGLVISSTWRYHVHAGDLTFAGFGVALKAAGGSGLDVLGVTPPSEGEGTRGAECRRWLVEAGWSGRCVALDDDGDAFAEHDIPWVAVDPTTGLTMADAEQAIAILKGDRY
jgi:hypothetical protein